MLGIRARGTKQGFDVLVHPVEAADLARQLCLRSARKAEVLGQVAMEPDWAPAEASLRVVALDGVDPDLELTVKRDDGKRFAIEVNRADIGRLAGALRRAAGSLVGNGAYVEH
jgi:hypothetical protein